MKYAVFSINGNQYRASEGEEFLVEGELGKEGEKLEVEKVLLYVDEGKVLVGTPEVKGAGVRLVVLGLQKGKKLDILKYKAKSRYRKHLGHRPRYTVVKVEKLSQKG